MWQPPPTNPIELADGDVHVWRISLAREPDEITALKRLLAPDEVERAERFYFQRHHDAFVAARAGLRNTLSRYVRLPADSLAFRYGDAGKPELLEMPQQIAGGEVAFNLSHSGDWAILAVARRGPLGVDIERTREMNDAAGLARRYFSAAEVAVWESLASTEQTTAFFRCWTRKEAYLKALGDGLRAPLDQFIVTFAPGEAPRLIQASPHDTHADWTIEDFHVADEYTAAVVVPGGSRVARFFSAE
jgi:4'-phosphopantetheinyl transferase